jgi:hypothetical protein
MLAANQDVYNPVHAHVLNKDGGAAWGAAGGVVYSTFTPPPIAFACCTNNGYYSSADPTLDLIHPNAANPLDWNNNSTLVVVNKNGATTDSSGNTIRYVIQRMCRTKNESPNPKGIEDTTLIPPETGCLFSNNAITGNETKVLSATEVCKGGGCAKAGQTVLMRITVRTDGPKNTVSYAQAIVY